MSSAATAALRLDSGASMLNGAFNITAPGGVFADLFQSHVSSGASAMCFGPSFSCAGSTTMGATLSSGAAIAPAEQVARTCLHAIDGTTSITFPDARDVLQALFPFYVFTGPSAHESLSGTFLDLTIDNTQNASSVELLASASIAMSPSVLVTPVVAAGDVHVWRITFTGADNNTALLTPLNASAAQALVGRISWTSAGSTTWTPPSFDTLVTFRLIGGGGGGGSANFEGAGGGGGSGAIAEGTMFVPGGSLPIALQVGHGGGGGAAPALYAPGNNGNDGEPTVFGPLTAGGGSAGQGGTSNPGNAGIGGTFSLGNTSSVLSVAQYAIDGNGTTGGGLSGRFAIHNEGSGGNGSESENDAGWDGAAGRIDLVVERA